MNKLKYLRSLNKKSQNEIALAINMSQSNYAKIERAEVALTKYQANILANFYNVSMSYLLDENNKDILITEDQYLKLIQSRDVINDIEKAVENAKKEVHVTMGDNNSKIVIGDHNKVK